MPPQNMSEGLSEANRQKTVNILGKKQQSNELAYCVAFNNVNSEHLAIEKKQNKTKTNLANVERPELLCPRNVIFQVSCWQSLK